MQYAAFERKRLKEKTLTVVLFHPKNTLRRFLGRLKPNMICFLEK